MVHKSLLKCSLCEQFKCCMSTNVILICHCNVYSWYIYLTQNSQAVKKECGPEKGYGEKRCEIQGGGQEMAVMVG